MSNPLHAAHYADGALWRTATVIENVQLARATYRVRLACPEVATRILPGQFVMLRIAGCNDPLLGRPLALYDVILDGRGNAMAIDIVYLALGKMTRLLAAAQTGDAMELWGPLGNGFLPRATDHLVMVAGGIGQTPFLALAAEYLGQRTYGDPPRSVAPARRVTFCYGARSQEYLAGVPDFERLGIEVRISTDDGSAGHRGFVTDLLREVIREKNGEPRVVCCGPEPMMEAAARIAKSERVACEVSLETPMACGIGICFSCVAKFEQPDGGWDYKRTCVEGPVFDAETIVW